MHCRLILGILWPSSQKRGLKLSSTWHLSRAKNKQHCGETVARLGDPWPLPFRDFWSVGPERIKPPPLLSESSTKPKNREKKPRLYKNRSRELRTHGHFRGVRAKLCNYNRTRTQHTLFSSNDKFLQKYHSSLIT